MKAYQFVKEECFFLSLFSCSTRCQHIGLELPLAPGLAWWSSNKTSALDSNAKVTGSNPTGVVCLCIGIATASSYQASLVV